MASDQALGPYQAIVMDHSRSPRSYLVMHDATHQAEGWNRLCGDRIVVYLKLLGAKIEAASFSGESCAICKASASMLMGILPGLNLIEAKDFLQRLGRFSDDWQPDQKLGPFEAFAVMRAYPTRLKCLRLPWRATEAALLAKAMQVSTEE